MFSLFPALWGCFCYASAFSNVITLISVTTVFSGVPARTQGCGDWVGPGGEGGTSGFLPSFRLWPDGPGSSWMLISLSHLMISESRSRMERLKQDHASDATSLWLHSLSPGFWWEKCTFNFSYFLIMKNFKYIQKQREKYTESWIHITQLQWSNLAWPCITSIHLFPSILDYFEVNSRHSLLFKVKVST